MKVVAVLGGFLLALELSHAYVYGVRSINRDVVLEPLPLAADYAVPKLPETSVLGQQTIAADFLNSKQHPLFVSGLSRKAVARSAVVRSATAAVPNFGTPYISSSTGNYQPKKKAFEAAPFGGYDYRPGLYPKLLGRGYKPRIVGGLLAQLG